MISIVLVTLGMFMTVYGVQNLDVAWYFTGMFYVGCVLVGISNGVARAGK